MAKRKYKNLFQNGDGNWCVDITVNGKRIIRVIGKSRKDAEDALATLRTDLLRRRYGLVKFTKEISFKDFGQKFLDTYASKKSSYERDEVAFRLHLVPFFGSFNLLEIRIEHVERYIKKRGEEKVLRGKEEDKKNLTAGATINRELALLRTMLNKAVEWEHLDSYPINWRRVRRLTENSRERFLTPEEKSRLFEEIDDSSPYLKPFLIIALNTGMRKNEVLGLRWADINLADSIITVEKTRRKNRRVLRIPINQPVTETLSTIPKISEYVFYNPETKERVKDVRTAFRTVCDRAKIKNLRIHDLRHTFGTNLHTRGVDLLTISYLLGHSSVTMTEKYIARVSDTMKKAVDLLAGDFNEKSNEAPQQRKKNERNDAEKVILPC
jgi:integrase